MVINHHIEDRILDALLKIIVKHRAKSEDAINEHHVFEQALSETQSTDHDGKLKEDYSDNWAKLILKPVLDADLLDILRLALQGNQEAVFALSAKLTSMNFDHGKRLAVVEVLARAFERGNKGADRVLENVISKLESVGFTKIKKDVHDTITKVSEYTAQYFKIMEPKFNPRPRLTKEPSDDDKGSVW